VGDAGGELADGLELLTLEQLFAEPAALFLGALALPDLVLHGIAKRPAWTCIQEAGLTSTRAMPNGPSRLKSSCSTRRTRRLI
jgi:hypothetical protein